jgi:hypothetical protein
MTNTLLSALSVPSWILAQSITSRDIICDVAVELERAEVVDGERLEPKKNEAITQRSRTPSGRPQLRLLARRLRGDATFILAGSVLDDHPGRKPGSRDKVGPPDFPAWAGLS